MKTPTFITCLISNVDLEAKSVEIHTSYVSTDLFKPNYTNCRALDYDVELLIPYLFNKKRGAKKSDIMR